MSISCNFMHNELPYNNSADTGLGNTLFQLATLYSLSNMYNLELNLYDLEIYCERLRKHNYDHDKILFKNFFNKFKKNKLTDNYNIIEYEEKNYTAQSYNNGVLDKIKNNIDKNILIKGYFQSHKYFDKYEKNLQELFNIPKDIKNNIKIKYPLLFDENVICISIHIRMNYANNVQFNKNYSNESIKYIENKINENKNGKKIHYLLFTNRFDLIKDWYNDKNNFTYVSNKMDYMDLWIMSLCKHNIISYSTFSWWGAYLNTNPDKIIIYPNDALKVTGGKLFNKIILPDRKETFFKKEWINIEIDTLYSKRL